MWEISLQRLLIRSTLWISLCLAGAAPAAALIYTYDNTTAGAVDSVTTPCANPLVRTFSVSDSFTVSSIAVGLNISHARRGDLRVTLVAPNNATLQIVTENAADASTNYDIHLSTNTEGTLDDGDTDPVAEPHYNRFVFLPTLAGFFTGNSAGTWSLRVCDTVATNSGTFNRARLVLSSAVAVANTCTSSLNYNWGTNGEAVAFTSANVGDVIISQTSTINFGNSTTTNNFQTRTTTSGNTAGYYSLTMDAPNISDSEDIGDRVVFTLSHPIRQFTFQMLDVDWTNTFWEDQVMIFGQDTAGRVLPFTLTPGISNQIAGNQVEGDTAAAPTSTDGNVAWVFDGAVKTVTIEYTQGNEPPNNPAFQLVGIGNFIYCAFDYGDAPNSYGTQLGSGGARHVMGDRTLYMGSNPPDGEANGTPAAAANTDDNSTIGGVNDEDGVTSFPAYSPSGTTYTVSVRAVNLSTTQAASLVGYIDWNRDGDFADANERSVTISIPANTNTPTVFNVTWTAVPPNAGGTTATYARFRIAYAAAEAQSPTGLAVSGEVEDYPIAVNTLPVTLSSFLGERSRSGLEVTWTTETETSTIGYTVSGWDGRSWQPLTGRLIPARALDSLTPQRYSLRLGDRADSLLRLEDVSLSGERTLHGPFAVGTLYGREPEVHRIDWEVIRADHELASEIRRALPAQASPATAPPGTVLAELSVTAEGLHRFTHADLLAAGIDLTGLAVDRLTLLLARSGQEVPIWVQGSVLAPGLFGPGGAIEFRGSPVAGSLYTRTRVYRLAVASSRGQRAVSRDGRPLAAPGPATYLATEEVQRDLAYSFASPNGDPWYEAPVLAQGGNPAERSFSIPADSPAASEGRLRVDLWGVTDWPGDAPDHHLILALNGTVLKEDRFDGLRARSYDLALPPGLLLPGPNQLTVRVAGDTGNAFDLVHIDRYALTYPRPFRAREGRLTFPAPASGGTLEVDGLPSPQVAVYAQDGQLRLTGIEVAASDRGYRARFAVPAVPLGPKLPAPRIDVVEASGFLHPEISRPRPLRNDLLTGTADYLIVSHPDFLGELDELVAARENQGHRVKVVDVNDLYPLYSGGEVDPAAIQTYVALAAKRLGIRSLLLVGGDSYDYLDHLGAGSISFVPTLYAQTDSLIRFSPADSLFGDVDRDGVQDLAVGRLPARTPAELRLLIDKTLRYPQTPAGAVFAADASEIRSFSGLSDRLAAQIPSAWPVTRAYVDDLGVAAARGRLLGAFNQGSSLVGFVGHSGPTVWTFQGLFAAADSAALTNTAHPSAVVQWGCWNTYYVAPQYDTLAQRLLLAGPQGAAAVVGSSTLSQESSDARMGEELVPRLLQRGTSIGEAIVQAKKAIARSPGGDRRDILFGWTLLGDPALVVNP